MEVMQSCLSGHIFSLKGNPSGTLLRAYWPGRCKGDSGRVQHMLLQTCTEDDRGSTVGGQGKRDWLATSLATWRSWMTLARAISMNGGDETSVECFQERMSREKVETASVEIFFMDFCCEGEQENR